MIWRVKNSDCYPKEWKVYPTRTFIETNDPDNYFVNLGDAWREANRRNEAENDLQQIVRSAQK